MPTSGTVDLKENQYPKTIYASTLLLGGKIIGWIVRDTKWNSVGEARCSNNTFWPDKGSGSVELKVKSFECNNQYEIDEAFREGSRMFFRQWPVHEEMKGFKPY